MVDETNELSPGAMNRRNALKAGAAIGIGAVALAGPQIGILGSVPAYAQSCSGVPDCVSTPKESINQGGGNCGGAAAFNNLPTSLSSSAITATISSTNGEGCLDSNLTVTITNRPANSYCIVCYNFFPQNAPTTSSCSQPSLGSVFTPPSVFDGDVPAGKMTISICCDDELSCL